MNSRIHLTFANEVDNFFILHQLDPVGPHQITELLGILKLSLHDGKPVARIDRKIPYCHRKVKALIVRQEPPAEHRIPSDHHEAISQIGIDVLMS